MRRTDVDDRQRPRRPGSSTCFRAFPALVGGLIVGFNGPPLMGLPRFGESWLSAAFLCWATLTGAIAVATGYLGSPPRLDLAKLTPLSSLPDRAKRDFRVEQLPVRTSLPRVRPPSTDGNLDRVNAEQMKAGTANEVPPPSRLYLGAKRSLDLALVTVLTLVAVPLLPIIALAIKLDSPGPVFYSQPRVGHRGRLFRIYKFRSMCVDAERHGAVWALDGDPRITRVGGFMRRSRLDELPQLWNVARGEMTFVGPRPERPEFTKLLASELPGYDYRQMVKPGLTGWAQIRYRYASSIEDSSTKLEYDLFYVIHRSLLLDIKILLLTIPVTVNLRGH